MEKTSDVQTPVLAGKRNLSVVRSSTDQLFQRLKATEQWAFGGETVEGVTKAYERFLALQIGPYAQAHLSFGRAFLAHSAPDRAIAALTVASNQAAGDLQAVLALGKAQVAARRYDAACDTFDQVEEELASPLARFIQDLHRQAKDQASLQRHALVVGIDHYANPDIASLAGAANDARAVRDALVQRLGFQPENVVLLLDAEATRERVLAEFRTLASKAQSDPALFYFAGHSSFQQESGQPNVVQTWVCADSRTENVDDLSPDEIAPQISYHLGRLLLASQQDYSRAVSELRSATRKDANNGRAFYYLGRAIREMVQRETLAEVEAAFGAYLNFGAPVGHRSEVVEFLRQRVASQAETPVR